MGRPFGPMPNLMATAEYVTKVHAICKRTGNLANYSLRTSASKDLVQLGETDSYEAVSRRIFWEEMQKQDKINEIYCTGVSFNDQLPDYWK